MKKYRVLKSVGDGSFGEVKKCQNIETGEIIAIKKMKQKFESWPECLKLREVQCLINLRSGNVSHENVIQLKSIFREKNQLHFVFEFMEADLYKWMVKQKKRGRYPSEEEIRGIMEQTFNGLNYIHRKGYFHRDMKPENLLVNDNDVNGSIDVKIADFGLAREIRSRPPFTDYVSTRWYRAPEVLLKGKNYSYPIDLFACGVIMAELYTLRPLFPGKSESDELYKLCSILGTPKKDDWMEGHKLAQRIGFKYPSFTITPLKSIIKNASPEAIDLMNKLMQWDPKKRPTCVQALNHPFFTNHRKKKSLPSTQISNPQSKINEISNNVDKSLIRKTNNNNNSNEIPNAINLHMHSGMKNIKSRSNNAKGNWNYMKKEILNKGLSPSKSKKMINSKSRIIPSKSKYGITPHKIKSKNGLTFSKSKKFIYKKKGFGSGKVNRKDNFMIGGTGIGKKVSIGSNVGGIKFSPSFGKRKKRGSRSKLKPIKKMGGVESQYSKFTKLSNPTNSKYSSFANNNTDISPKPYVSQFSKFRFGQQNGVSSAFSAKPTIISRNNNRYKLKI